jgi:hypothetical protein
MPGMFGRPFGTYLVSVCGSNAEVLRYSRMSLRDRDKHTIRILKF